MGFFNSSRAVDARSCDPHPTRFKLKMVHVHTRRVQKVKSSQQLPPSEHKDQYQEHIEQDARRGKWFFNGTGQSKIREELSLDLSKWAGSRGSCLLDSSQTAGQKGPRW